MRSILIFMLLVCCLLSVEPDLASDRAALITLRTAVGGRSLLWNLTNSHCSWVGVFCDSNRTKVVELRVPGMGLLGQLPLGLGNLTDLQTLSLRFNALSGPIPADIGNLRSLRNLYLQGNFFSSEISESLFGLENLVRLNLANNNFSGGMPSGFNRLTRLATLYLEQNHLTGKIPDLNLPLDQFNVSFNNLHGEVPKGLSGMPATAFEGNSLCGGPLVACKGKKLSGGAIAGIVIGGVVLLLVILMILICLCRRKSGEKEGAKHVESQPKQSEVEAVPRQAAPAETANVSTGYAGVVAKAEAKSGGGKNLVFFARKPAFDLDDLLRASAEVLGKGTFGTAYKASLETGMVVAVKRLKEVNVPEKEFCEKIEVVGKMNHENLVPLIAYYYSRDEKLLVYDYMPMGSVSALLHGNRGGGRTPLNWETRSGIALGAARGIAYIHAQGSTTSHGNIKSSNILLTNSFAARVSDFGLAHLAGTPTATPNRVEGYRAPEVTDGRKVSQKADVYSFGVLLLELLTGKPPTQSLLNEDGVDLPRWVQSVVKEEWTAEVFDIELLRYQNVEEEMVQLLQLAIDCTAQYPDTRPTMAEVRTQIEEICQSSTQKHQTEGDISDDLQSPQQPSS